jgi:serine protease AprX
MKRAVCFLFLLHFSLSSAFAGLDIVRSNGITLTGADGVNFVRVSGITLTGADGFLAYNSNGITLTGADGMPITLADQVTTVGADGAGFTGPNGITLTGADGITLTGADGITLTGADGVTLTGPNGVVYQADSVLLRRANGITLTGADGITLTGADGVAVTGPNGAYQAGPNGITLTGADGITLTGADGITLTGADSSLFNGADSVTGFNTAGVAFDLVRPTGLSLNRTNGITLTGADGITLTGADDIVFRNIDGISVTDPDGQTGLQSVDPEFAVTLNNATDDSSVNAVVVYHDAVTDADLDQLRQIGILGGTRFRMLPMVYVTGTKSQIIAISHLAHVRSIYGNRTLNFDSDPYFKITGIQRVAPDNDLLSHNSGSPVTGRNVTVAVLDTGINSNHADLAGKVVQNVRLLDTQSAPADFVDPVRVENVADTDPVAGHGTFVAGIVAASGARSNGKYAGVAPGARLLGLSAGDVNLVHVLSGFDYLLDRGPGYNVKVVNCSFSANTVYDVNDPVNIATKMLTDRGVSVVVSAGNDGPGNGTINPYSVAPWVIGVGATDEKGTLASFSSRGTFGGQQPTLVAPGVNVASLRSNATVTSVSGLGGADLQRLTAAEMPYYTTASGTSFSAPQVAGAIALMLEANPNLTPKDIKEILSRSSTPLPKYFYHEAGAGMLNTHAAVLESAFPARRTGEFRSTDSRNPIQFVTYTSQSFSETVFPDQIRSVNTTVPAGVVQAGLHISWGLSANDFGLKLFDSNNNLVGESNYLNLPGLTGRREEIVLRNPASQAMRAAIQNTAGAGTAQTVNGALEVTRVQYPPLTDVAGDSLADVQKCILANIIFPTGSKFRPDSSVSRADLASVLMHAGLAPQYIGANPMFVDVRDYSTRSVVESVQGYPDGRLFYDASPGSNFYPNNMALRLMAAVAFVRAAGLEGLTTTATLPATVTDAASIPVQWRGHVAVAMQKGFLSLSATRFEPNRAITRIELVRAVNALMR